MNTLTEIAPDPIFFPTFFSFRTIYHDYCHYKFVFITTPQENLSITRAKTFSVCLPLKP